MFGIMLLRNGEDYLSSFWIIINTTILKCQMKLGVAAQNCNPNLGRVKQEDYKSELNLSFKGSLHVRKKKEARENKMKNNNNNNKTDKNSPVTEQGNEISHVLIYPFFNVIL